MAIKWFYIVSFWEGYLTPYGEVYYILAIPKSETSLNKFVSGNYTEMEIFIIPQDPDFYMTAHHRMRETSPNQYFMIRGDEVEYPFVLDDFQVEEKFDAAHGREITHHIHSLLV